MNVTGRKGKVQCIIAKWGMGIIITVITINLVAVWFSRLLLSSSKRIVCAFLKSKFTDYQGTIGSLGRQKGGWCEGWWVGILHFCCLDNLPREPGTLSAWQL